MNRSGLPALAVYLLICLASIALGCWLRTAMTPEWLQIDKTRQPPALRPWMVEADCYSQLARVQRILQGQGLVQNHFTVENWPEGLTPSTTAPFDYVILLLVAPLALFTRYPLDWAGALISPLLWLALALFWTVFRSREFNRIGKLLLVLGSAALPALIWATACGRPRHQSLILALMAMGLTAEYERWSVELTPKRAWNIFAGVVWGLACWTSLYEPVAVFGVVVLFNLAVRRRESPACLISFGSVMLVALLIEGVHVFVPPPEYLPALHRWLATVTEMRGLEVATLVQRMTLVLLVLPFVAWRLLARAGERKTDVLLVILTLMLTLFTAWQQRWVYYATLGELFLIVRYCQLKPLRWSRVVVLFVFFAGVFSANYDEIEARQNVIDNQPSMELMRIAKAIDQPGGILAPWWLSPGLLYFSGQPIVSGSSHCGISGIVASAKFYAATSWLDAARVLKERQVRWVVVYDDPGLVYPVLNTSCGILGLPFYSDDSLASPDATVAQILINDQFVPTSLRLRAVTTHLKLYEYTP